MWSVKVLNDEGRMLDRLARSLHEFLNAGYRVGQINVWSDRLLFVVEIAIAIFIAYFRVQFVFDGRTTLGFRIEHLGAA